MVGDKPVGFTLPVDEIGSYPNPIFLRLQLVVV
jgi:hypothetical protein